MNKNSKGKRLSYAGVFLLLCMAITTIAVKAPENEYSAENEQIEKNDSVESEVIFDMQIEEDEQVEEIKNDEIDIEPTSETTNENVEIEISYSKPVSGAVISEYSMDVPVYSKTMCDYRTHKGIDFSVTLNEAVHAAESGEVIYAKKDDLMGETVKIKHPNGDITVYSGLLSTSDMVEGQAVTKGQVIGLAGGSIPIEDAEEMHLHFEIVVEGHYKNPTELLKNN